MIRFQNQNEFVKTKVNEVETSVSTLLIPSSLLKDFTSKRKKYNGNTSFYLRSLLRRFRSLSHTGLLPEPISIKTEYQSKDQDLQKINFRPRNEDWIELGEVALAFGKSRCFVFVYLLKLDLLNLWTVLVEAGLHKVVPTIPNQSLMVFWKYIKVQHRFSRGYHTRI